MTDAIIKQATDNRVAVPTDGESRGRITVLTADMIEDVEPGDLPAELHQIMAHLETEAANV